MGGRGYREGRGGRVEGGGEGGRNDREGKKRVKWREGEREVAACFTVQYLRMAESKNVFMDGNTVQIQ